MKSFKIIVAAIAAFSAAAASFAAEPRFRLLYVNGGYAGFHSLSLMAAGRNDYRRFVLNGVPYRVGVSWKGGRKAPAVSIPQRGLHPGALLARGSDSNEMFQGSEKFDSENFIPDIL